QRALPARTRPRGRDLPLDARDRDPRRAPGARRAAELMSAAARLVEVALPLPLLRTFTYAVPERTRHPVMPGSRVVAPVRGKRVIGVCIGESDGRSLGDKAAKPLLDVPDATPALPADLLAVCQWISEYYVAPLGLVRSEERRVGKEGRYRWEQSESKKTA